MIDWHRHFRHDTHSGILFWKPAPEGYCKNDRYTRMWNTRFANKPAGWEQFTAKGALIGICISMKAVKEILLAHRIIWEMHHGPIPDGKIIDHENGNPIDNRIANLRLATHSQNMMNSKLRKNNRYGMKGIRLLPYGKYEARIQVKGKQTSLGVYHTMEEAHAAYCQAAPRYHGEFARTA